MRKLILLKFSTKVQLSISNKNDKIVLRLIENIRHSDVITVNEDSIVPKHSYKKVLPWQQQGIYNQTFTFKQIPIYFQKKSPNLFELSFSLPELCAGNLKGGAENLPGRIELTITIYLCNYPLFELLKATRTMEVIDDWCF